jgi:RNA polymerase sigma-70 factor, ECF subfamily
VRYADSIVAEVPSAALASDALLALRLAAGDGEAEAELFRRLAPRVRLYGLRHLRDRAAADDLVQDVLLGTFDALRAGKVRDPERLASYVLGTCRRVAAGWRRGAERRRKLLEVHGRTRPSFVPAEEPPVDLDRLALCLARLSERERTVVVLTFYAERSGDEIAAELGMQTGHVRVARHRGLARLRACMEGE